MKIKIYILFLFLFSQAVFSQVNVSDRLSFSLRGRYGFLIPHHSSFVYLIEDHIKSYDFTISIKTKGDKYWQQLYRCPELGIGFYHANLGNPDYLGNVNAGYGIIRIPIIQHSAINFYYSMAGGVAFLNRPFNVTGNIYNLAIGSKANAFVDLGLNTEIRCFNRLCLNAGLQFTHYSNGAWKVPNLGFNIPSVNAGIKYCLKKPEIPVKKPETKNNDFKREFEFGVLYMGGLRENPPPNGRKFYASSVSMYSEKQITPRRMLGAGLDIFWDPSISQRLKTDSTQAEIKNNFRSGIHVSHNLVFNKVYFVMQVGYYFYTHDTKGDGYLYSRFGLRINVTKHFAANLTLKTHKFKADVIELGIGYYFKR